MTDSNQQQKPGLYEASGAKEIVVRTGHSLAMWGIGAVVVGLVLWFGVPWAFNKMIWAPVEATVEATKDAAGAARDAAVGAAGAARDATHDAIVTTRERTGDAVEAAQEQAAAARRRAAEIGAGALDTTVSTAGNMREALGAAAGQAGEALAGVRAGAQQKLDGLAESDKYLPDWRMLLKRDDAEAPPPPAQPDVQ